MLIILKNLTLINQNADFDESNTLTSSNPVLYKCALLYICAPGGRPSQVVSQSDVVIYILALKKIWDSKKIRTN